MNATARKKNTPAPAQPLALVGIVEESRAVAPVAADTSPDGLLALALQQGANMETLERLMALKERHDANEARKAFVAAMADFKHEDLAIGKNKHVSFTTSKGTTSYDHAELFDVTDVVVPALAKHGISHRWTVKQDQARITVACVLTHRLGHSESVEMTAGADDSGGKNSIQAIASTKTYLERYTLLAATGLATGGDLGGESDDDDGRGYEQEPTEAERLERRKAQCLDAAARHAKAVEQIHDYIGRFDVSQDVEQLRTVAIAWAEIPEVDQMALWLAPTKGGVLSTHERDVIKTQLPKLEPTHG